MRKKLMSNFKNILNIFAVVVLFIVIISIPIVILLTEKPDIWRVTFYENGKPVKVAHTNARFDEGYDKNFFYDLDTKHVISLTGEYDIVKE
jgi:hypothetical protein